METSSIIGYLVNALKFKQEEKDHKSFYREIPIGGSKMVVIRISNHRTHLQTWADRYPKNLHPSKKITKRMGRNLPIIFRQKAFYSFVFEDEPSQNDTNVRDGRIITVYESVKQSRDIKDDRQLILIGEALSTFISNQEQYDEQILGKLQPITNKIQENKQNINTNKIVMKLNESELRNIIKESIKKTLNEGAFGQMENSIKSGNNAGNRIMRNQNGQTVQNQNNMMQNRQQAQNQNQNVQNNPNTLNQILIPLKNLLSFENNLKEKYKTCSDNEIGMYQNILNDISQIKQYLVSAGLFK